MKQCGQCGTQNLDQQSVCSGCGAALPAAAPSLGGTLVMPPPEPPPPPGPPATAQPSPPKANLRGTMIGIAPPTFVPPEARGRAPSEPPPGVSASQPPPANSPSQPPARHFGATMIGMAPPAPTGANTPSASPAYPSPPPAPPVSGGSAPGLGSTLGLDGSASGVGGAPRLASKQKTVLGVARPGIAPLNPGQAKPAAAAVSLTPPTPAPPSAQPPVSWQHVQNVQPPSARTGPPSPRVPQPRRISLGATLAIVGAAALLVLAIVAFFMLRGHGAVTARAALDQKGNEVLTLACTECPDGTKVWIDTAPAAFTAGKATLKLSSPLKVGENPIVLVLERPGRTREEIALGLPIEYRVRSSTDELAQDAPKLSVLANVLEGTKLEVDGKPVTPDPAGAVRFDYDVSKDVTGPEASVKTLERIVPYKATSANGSTQSGQVEIRLGITPLIVDAPGASIVVGDKQIVLAGRTAPGSQLQVGAQEVALDPEGRFVSKQSLALGENSFMVRSTLKDHAPRLVKISVRRSDNLEREAALARSMAQTSYQEVMRAPDAATGRSLALEGQLFDLRRDGYSSVLLVDVKGGCKKAPCLAKVIYGTDVTASKGRSLKAFGKLQRFVDGPRSGERIPELRADLVVAGGP